jgi:capping protein (actin filament) muscle Z-line, beta
MTPMTAYEPEGSWDSIHVFETAERGRQAHYKLTSTVMLHLLTRKGTDDELGKGDIDSKGPEGWKREGEVSLSGSMTRQVCGNIAPSQSYVSFFGRILRRKSFHSCYAWVNL